MTRTKLEEHAAAIKYVRASGVLEVADMPIELRAPVRLGPMWTDFVPVPPGSTAFTYDEQSGVVVFYADAEKQVKTATID